MNAVVRCFVLSALLVLPTAAHAQERLKVGNVVWAEWMPNAWFHGKIAKVAGKQYHIAFDDGDKAVVEAPKIALDRVPAEAAVKRGTRVLAKFKKGNFYPGKVTDIDGDLYDIKFDDGDVDRVKRNELRLIAK
jgi:hypothetical protein